MTFSLPAISNLWARVFAPAAPKAVPPAESKPGSYRLRHPLVVTATRARGRESFTLLASEMGTTSLVFRTDRPVHAEEVLEIQVLLQGVGSLRFLAHVEYTLGAGGRLLFQPSDPQQIAILSYLHKQAERCR